MLKSLLLSSIIVNVGLLLGRVTGFVREVVIAGEYGAGPESDVIIFVLSISDLLLNILVGGGLAAALIPEFAGEAPRLNKQALLAQSLLLFVLFAFVFALGIFIFDDFVISTLAPGFGAETVLATKGIYSVVVWIIPLTVCSGVLTAYLNAGNRFTSSSLGTFCLNLFIIAGLLMSTHSDSTIAVLGIFVLLGGAARIAIQLLELSVRTPWSYVGVSMSPWLVSSEIIYRYLQVAFSGSLILCLPLIFRAFATNLGEGYYSVFNYAFKLVELPQVLLLGFVTVVLFPKLASSFVTDKKLYLKIVGWGARASILLSVLALVACYVFSRVFVDIVFGYGKMSSVDLQKIAEVFDILVLSLPFTALALYLIMVFNSTKRTGIPLVVNGVTLLLMLWGIFHVEDTFANYATIYVLTYALSCTLSLTALYFVDRHALASLFKLRWLGYIAVLSVGYLYILNFVKMVVEGYFFIVLFSVAAFILIISCFLFLVPEARSRLLASRYWS